jgi:hypothetical protein
MLLHSHEFFIFACIGNAASAGIGDVEVHRIAVSRGSTASCARFAMSSAEPSFKFASGWFGACSASILNHRTI